MSADPKSAELLSDIIAALPSLADLHAPATAIYRILTAAARSAVVPMFGPGQTDAQTVASFGPIRFPYRRMGAVDSLDLFGLDELIIFAFYWANRTRYRRTADIGANIGLHSLIMARCGFEVTSYEPDPTHVALLNDTLKDNAVTTVTVVPAAVSDEAERPNSCACSVTPPEATSPVQKPIRMAIWSASWCRWCRHRTSSARSIWSRSMPRDRRQKSSCQRVRSSGIRPMQCSRSDRSPMPPPYLSTASD